MENMILIHFKNGSLIPILHSLLVLLCVASDAGTAACQVRASVPVVPQGLLPPTRLFSPAGLPCSAAWCFLGISLTSVVWAGFPTGPFFWLAECVRPTSRVGRNVWRRRGYFAACGLIRISTRRFLARPASVSLPAIGWFGPMPMVRMRLAVTPRACR